MTIPFSPYLLAIIAFFYLSAPFLWSESDDKYKEFSGKKSKDGKKKKEVSFPHAGEEEIRMLRRLLELPPARLKMLRKTIERLENYSEEERETLKKKLAHFRSTSPEERDRAVNHLLKRHAILREHLDKLSPSERAKRMQKFQSLNLSEKKKFLEDLNKTSEDRKKS